MATLNTRSTDRARITRAATESMEILPTDKAWRFTVRTAHGIYTVDAQAKTCTCKDFRNRILRLRRQGDRDAACKHLLRVTNGTRLDGASIMRRPRSGRRAKDAPSQAQLLIGTKERKEWEEAV